VGWGNQGGWGGEGWSRTASAASYVGPGDIVAAGAWWGLRAYSAAKAGTAAVRIIRASDSTQQDFNTLANGSLDTASIATFLTATTGKIVTLYDQTGGGYDLTQGTDASRPAYTANAIGSLPCLTTSGGATSLEAATTLSWAQPYTFLVVVSPTDAPNNTFVMCADPNAFSGFVMQYGSGGSWIISAGTNLTGGAATQGSFQVVQAVANSTSSSVKVDGGSLTTGNAGTQSTTYHVDLGDQAANTGNCNGRYLEAGIWHSAVSSANQTSLNSNIHTYWGF
jgi:hypothetical protein